MDQKSGMELVCEIDSFYKNECYDPHPFFIDKDDLEIYRSEDTIYFAQHLFTKIWGDVKYRTKLKEQNISIVCYVLCIKFYTDCFICPKPYSALVGLFEIESSPQHLSDLEKRILKKINYIFDYTFGDLKCRF